MIHKKFCWFFYCCWGHQSYFYCAVFFGLELMTTVDIFYGIRDAQVTKEFCLIDTVLLAFKVSLDFILAIRWRFDSEASYLWSIKIVPRLEGASRSTLIFKLCLTFFPVNTQSKISKNI
jgi:hypothetical protein